MKYVKKFIKFLFRLYGYEIFRKFYYEFGADDSLGKIMKSCNRDEDELVVIDVGANVGQSVQRFRNLFPNSKIYAFEPHPRTFTLLAKATRNMKFVKCFNLGLGATKGSQNFYIQPDSGSNSFKKLDLEGEAFALSHTKEALKNHNVTTMKEDVLYNTEILVPVDMLENICNLENINKIDVLKIDTQGYELDVLLGAKSILPKTLVIEAEVIFSGSYENIPGIGEIESFLRSFGFAIWDFPYIGKFATNSFNRINFVDVHFVNTRLFNQLNAES